MLGSAACIARSARPYLWSVVLINCVVSGVSLGMSVDQSLCVAAILSCLASFGFLLNDVVDRDIDKVNGQNRLVDASPQTRSEAIATAVSLAVVSIVLALYMENPRALLLTLSVLIGLILYNMVLRRVPFVATALASWLCASPLWFVMGLMAEQVTLVHILVLKMAVVGAFSREVMLDLKDVRGDRAFRRYTIPAMLGWRISCIMAVELTLACCGFGLASFFLLSNGPPFAIWSSIFLVLACYLLIVPTFVVLKLEREDTFHQYVRLTRFGLLTLPPFVLLGAILLG